MTMFEQASRQKVRFESPKGLLTAEDLWDLPLTSGVGKANLDDITKGLHRQLKNSDDVSFVKPATTADASLQLKFDIAKYVIDVKVAERDAAAVAAANADKKQKILSIIARKQDGALEAASLEELQQMAQSL